MTEDHHLFMTVGLLTGSAQPSGFSENSLTSPSFSDTYEPSASNRHEEETPSPALHTLPARMARKRQRPSITDHEHEPLFSAQTSETQTSALTPVKKLSEVITHDDHRAQQPKRIRTDSNKPRTKDEKTELPINIQSPRRLSRSDSRSSKMSQPKKALSSHAPMVPLVGRNAPRHDQVSKFSEFDNPSDTNFTDVLGLNYVSERKFRVVKGGKDDLKNLKSVPVVSESRDSVERGLSAPRLSQNLTKTGDDGDDQGHQVKKARAVKKPSPSSGPSPLVSIPSGLGWGGLGHLVG
ncbi:hypothetical protein K435DRAFT_255029 [Dendrothele bispora CBS 962.96]|uniref:Uncharacterized protein n=1 Tax=Dendrothele bispora (strain CBS 962.96) TaxID=1314807 RepID=A0A4S8LNV1_DENBC|nr:hypothetical protein K435DRAFT_255029 [Dendrothele bispora CBS 962.96]